MPAFEDPSHWLLKEAGLPSNVGPSDPKSPIRKRARAWRVPSSGAEPVQGFVLPIQRWNAEANDHRWKSEQWKLRRGNLFLMPGDSPLGLRLPIASLPNGAERISLYRRAGSAGAARGMPVYDGAAPSRRPPHQDQEQQSRRRRAHSDVDRDPRRYAVRVHAAGGETRRLSRTGRGHRAGRPRNGTQVHIEGYPPPNDPRMDVIKVTPDPGVIEVNIHPAQNWREAVDTTTALYEEARQSRLGADKFMLDGRHIGTGGGNHVVIGGAIPQDSPFLRRPDVLRSLVLYWQRHPSLSYLFSGMFVGPTSQAPRMDEARHDGLYELEIALSQCPKVSAAPMAGRSSVPQYSGRHHR